MEETMVPREAAALTVMAETAKEAKDPSRQVDLRRTRSMCLLGCTHTIAPQIVEETVVRRVPREAAARTLMAETAKEAKDPSRQVDLRRTRSLRLVGCTHTIMAAAPAVVRRVLSVAKLSAGLVTNRFVAESSSFLASEPAVEDTRIHMMTEK
jgi:regulator of extracellular matrix RemA (YlzA/DUF370 family)